jgi:hypothetical protein
MALPTEAYTSQMLNDYVIRAAKPREKATSSSMRRGARATIRLVV